jgi:carboxyl-terminal processing protease
MDEPSSGKDIVGNGDGVLQVGERVRLRVWIENTGGGKALDSWVHLRNLVGDAVFLHTGREKLGELAKGKQAVAELDFEVRKTTSDGDVRMQLTVSDNKIGEYVSQKLVFPIYREDARVEKGPEGVTTRGKTDLRSAPEDEAPVVAQAEAGASFESLGVVSGWTKVDLGKKRFAWVKSTEVDDAKAPRKPGPFVDAYSVSPPAITLTTTKQTTEGKSVHISGTASDEHGVRDIFITVVNPSRDIFGRAEKVFYQASAHPTDGRLDFAADVPLTPGNNLIEIVAREDEEVVGTARMWVLRTSGLEEARMAEASHDSRGNLSVDRLGGGR